MSLGATHARRRGRSARRLNLGLIEWGCFGAFRGSLGAFRGTSPSPRELGHIACRHPHATKWPSSRLVTIFAATRGAIAFDHRATTTEPPRSVTHLSEPAILANVTIACRTCSGNESHRATTSANAGSFTPLGRCPELVSDATSNVDCLIVSHVVSS